MGISSTNRRPLVIAVVAVLVLALILGVVAAIVTSSDSDDAGGPAPTSSPTLSLARTSTSGLAEAAAGGGVAAGYRLATTLPGTRDTGVVITPAASKLDAAQVGKLLDAVGLSGVTPKQVDGGWTANGTVQGQKAEFALDERAGNVWQFVRGPRGGCLSINPGAAPDDSVSCAAATTSPGSDPDTIDRAALDAEAKKLFAVVGVKPGAGLRVNKGGGVSYLDVPLEVEGLPVVGVNLSVGADRSGIVSATGWLDPTFTTVGRYPLVSAKDGFEQLLTQPVPAIGRACPTAGGAEPGTAAACPSPTPAAVTAARLAWLTTRDAELGVVLAPAWQFEVDGFYGPAVVAVDPRYLSTPADPGVIEPDGTGGAGAGSAEPGSVEPAPAVSPAG